MGLDLNEINLIVPAGSLMKIITEWWNMYNHGILSEKNSDIPDYIQEMLDYLSSYGIDFDDKTGGWFINGRTVIKMRNEHIK